MKIERFEDIEVWQQARIFVKKIYEATSVEKMSREFSLKDQIRRASVSVMSNIAEGFERKSKNEFLHYLHIAKASSGEVRSQLYLLIDLGFIVDKKFNELYAEIELISKSIGGFIKYLKGRGF